MDILMNSPVVQWYKNLTLVNWLEILGAICGIAGALIMSFQPELALYSWTIWLASAFFLGVFAWLSQLMFLLALQSVFFVINISGIINTIQ